MIKALIFDFFGVIRPGNNGVVATYRRLGGDVVADEVFLDDVKTAGNFGLINDADQQIADRLGVSLGTWLAALDGTNNDQVLLDYIIELRSQGYKIGLLSNADAHLLGSYFQPNEVNRYFDAALLSGDVGIAKPAALFYRLIAEKLEVMPEECVMIDDRPEFCAGARYIGMQAIEYRHFDQFKTDLERLLTDDSTHGLLNAKD